MASTDHEVKPLEASAAEPPRETLPTCPFCGVRPRAEELKVWCRSYDCPIYGLVTTIELWSWRSEGSASCRNRNDEPQHCPKCGGAITMQQSLDDIGLAFTGEEEAAIAELSKLQDLSAAQIIRQALRVYQLLAQL